MGERVFTYGLPFDGLGVCSVSPSANRDFIDAGLQPDGRMAFYVNPWQHLVPQQTAIVSPKSHTRSTAPS